MKKKSSIILLFVLAVVTSMCFFACKKDEEPTPDPAPAAASITLDKTSVSLDVYESVVLTANIENVTESLVWSSSNTAVATVDDGKVTAVAAGSATVTVTGSGASATCAVTVTDSHTAPVLRVEHEEIAVALNGTYDLKIETLWKSEALTDIEYVWSVADGQPDDVVSVENIATGARFTGLKYGETVLYVKADVRGTRLVQKIAVKVCNVDITFEVSNLTKGDTYYEANVALIATDTDSASVTPDVKIYDKQVLVDNPEIAWTVADETVATVTGGVITALKEGETLVTATYDNNDITILVKAYRPEIAIADEVTLETSVGTFSITSDLQGTISGVTIADTEVMSAVDGKNFTLDKEKLPKDAANLGAQKITVETDKAKYVISANIYTKILKTADDILSWQTLAHEQETDLKFWNGYFALGNDIDMTGKTFSGIFDYYSMNSGTTWLPFEGYEGMVFRDGSTGGFRGTFDGCGYTISNLKLTKTTDSFIGQMTSQGVVKNVSFTGVELGGTTALITVGGSGTIENVYAEIAAYSNGSSNDDKTGVFNQKAQSGAKINNCIAVFNCATSENVGFVGMARLSLGNDILNGVYGIGIDSSIAIMADGSGSDVYGAYANLGMLKASGIDFTSWAGDFWQIINGIPYPKKLALPEATVPAVTVPEISGIGADITVSGFGKYDVVKLSDDAIALDVTVENNIIKIPASIAGGTEITFTVYNIFDESKKVDLTVVIADSANVAVSGTTDVVVKDGNDFNVDFGEKASEVEGDIESVTVDGAAFITKTYASGVLTLDTQTIASLTGVHGVSATFVKRNGSAIEKITYVTFDIDVTTMMIRTEEDLNNFITVSQEIKQGNSWLGLFKLANDITLTGTYASNYVPGDGRGDIGTAIGFNGTFDGQGYTIYNFTPRGDLASLTGQLGQNGVIKNVSFVNVDLDGDVSVISTIAAGTVENVYVHIGSVTDNGKGWAYGTAVIANDAYGTARFKNIVVEYGETLPASYGTGYPIYNYNSNYGIMTNVYAVGASKVYGVISEWVGDVPDVCAAYADYAAMNAAGVTLENDFWTMKNGMPVPKKLAATASIGNTVVSIPSSTTTLTVKVTSPFASLSLDEAADAAGFTLNGNVVTIPANASVSSFTVTVTSLLDGTVKATKTFYIVSSETITVSDRTRMEMSDGDDLTVDLSSYNVSGSLTELKVGDTAIDLAGVTFEGGTLTVTKSALGTVYGEQNIVATFETTSGDVLTKITTVSIPVLAVTKVLTTADDILNWNTLAYAADSAKEYWGGYFELGNDIDMAGKNYEGNFSYADLSYTEGEKAWTTKEEFGGLVWINGDTGGFRGTFDGCGYTIKNITMAKGNGSFVGQMARGGVIKNVSFTNVTLNAGNALVSVGGNGTIENVYAHITSLSGSWSTGDATGVLYARGANGTMSGAKVNKCLVVFDCSAAANGYNSCLGRFDLGNGILNEVYAVGTGLTKDNMLEVRETVGTGDGDVYGGYESLDAFKAAGVANWENDFWTMVDGVPTPKKLDPESVSDPYGLKNKTELTIDFTPGYYLSTSNAEIFSGLAKFQCTATKLTKTDIPVGSIIWVASGWQYRPEGWVNGAVNASRPAEVSATYVVVTEEWWGNFTERAFNISRTDGADISSYDDTAMSAVFKIYVPKTV